jgi:hypothetical protein
MACGVSAMNAMLALPAAPQLPRTLAGSLNELPFGSQSQIRVGDGQIAAFLAYAGYEKAIGTVKYALRVLNNTPFTARARLFVDVRGAQLSAYPRDIEIAPFSMRDDVLPVRMDVTGPFDRAIVEVASEETYFTIEAPPPPRTRPQWGKWAALAIVPLVGMGAAQMWTPRILGVEAPQRALAGTMVRVPYQTSGSGTVEYDFVTRDGLQLAAGLTQGSGVLSLQVPAGGAGSPYALHIRIRSAFAHAAATASIAAMVPQRKVKPREGAGAAIDDLAVSPSPAKAGSALTVSYVTKARTGEVYLLDTFGRTWARAPLAASGITTIGVPQAAAGRQMRVVLSTANGKDRAQSSVGVSVLPSESVAAVQASPVPPKATARPAVTAPDIQLSSSVVSPGDTVTVTVNGAHEDVRITVMSGAGATMAQGDVDASNDAVTLNAPTVSAVTTFYVVATVTSGVSQQTTVHRLVVTPR